MDVRFGSKADICIATSHVRSTPNSNRESGPPQNAMSALPSKADMCGKDSDSGDIFLMHSGKIGGGRPGIGKSAFLAWSKASLIEVSEMNGKTRSGIPIAK